MDDARTRLEEERQKALDRLASLTRDYDEIVAASRDSNADDEHDPEGSTIAFERSQVGALASQIRAHLAEIDLAVTRITTGTYTTCEHCGNPIAAERLQARPATRTCTPCASIA